MNIGLVAETLTACFSPSVLSTPSPTRIDDDKTHTRNRTKDPDSFAAGTRNKRFISFYNSHLQFSFPFDWVYNEVSWNMLIGLLADSAAPYSTIDIVEQSVLKCNVLPQMEQLARSYSSSCKWSSTSVIWNRLSCICYVRDTWLSAPSLHIFEWNDCMNMSLVSDWSSQSDIRQNTTSCGDTCEMALLVWLYVVAKSHNIVRANQTWPSALYAQNIFWSPSLKSQHLLLVAWLFKDVITCHLGCCQLCTPKRLLPLWSK